MTSPGFIPRDEVRDATPDPALVNVAHTIAHRLTGEQQGGKYFQYVAGSVYGSLVSAVLGSLLLDRVAWERECELDDAWDTAKRLREAA